MFERDAASAGVDPVGGLFNTADIKILICYVLSVTQEPLDAAMLSNVLHYEGIANAFEVSDAITSLQKNGMLMESPEKPGCFFVTREGNDVAKTLNTSLAMTVKERACKIALKMLAREKNARESSFEITHENEKTYITCTAHDGTAPFLSVKMLVPDDTQAQFIKEQFLNRAGEIYSGIVKLLTNYKED